MDITTKSAIGLALTGVTATGGYFGWKAFSSSGSLAQKDWENKNKEWFNKKYLTFKNKANNSDTYKGLSDQWLELQNQFSGKEAMSDYELARKLQEWCKAPDNSDKFTKIKEECTTLNR